MHNPFFIGPPWESVRGGLYRTEQFRNSSTTTSKARQSDHLPPTPEILVNANYQGDPASSLVINGRGNDQLVVDEEETTSKEESQSIGEEPNDTHILLRNTPPHTPQKIPQTPPLTSTVFSSPVKKSASEEFEEVKKSEEFARADKPEEFEEPEEETKFEEVNTQLFAIDSEIIQALDNVLPQAQFFSQPPEVDDAIRLTVALAHKEEKSYGEALVGFSALAEQDSLEGGLANFHLGEMYEYGWGVDVDLQKARACYEQAKFYSGRANYRLGRIAEKEKQPEDAHRHYENAELKSPTRAGPALRRLANMSEVGTATPQNSDRAIERYKKAIAKGDVKANIKLGQLFQTQGKDAQALQCYEQAFESFQKVPELVKAKTFCQLGDAFRLAADTQENKQKALSCYLAAEKKLSADDQRSNLDECNKVWIVLGELHRELGDDDQAFEYFVKVQGKDETKRTEEHVLAALRSSFELFPQEEDEQKGSEYLLRVQKEDGAKITAANALVGLGHSYYQRYKECREPQVFTKVVLCHTHAHEMGLVNAYMSLGEIYEEEKEYRDALYYYRLTNSTGAGEACRLLGVQCLESGREEIVALAAECFDVAVEKGCVEALNDRGKLLLAKGEHQKAEDSFLQAAKGANFVGLQPEAKPDTPAKKSASNAWLHLGDFYLKQQNYVKAFESFEQGIGRSAAEGLRKLGHIHQKGGWLKEAIKCYECAINKGSAATWNDLGCLYLDQKDYSKAASCFRQGRDKKHPEATNNLGKLHLSGHLGDSPNYGEALACFNEAIALGFHRANANIGYLYYLGQGVPQSFQIAKDYFIKAAAAGSSSACYFLGKLYHYGEGVKSDYAKALYWYHKAIKLNKTDSETITPFIEQLKSKHAHLQNEEGENNFYHHFPLAEAGNAESQYQLGVMYKRKDCFVVQSDTNVEYYLTLAYDNGHPAAAFELADSFENRIDLRTRSTEKALEWYGKACQPSNGKEGYQAAVKLMNSSSKEHQIIALNYFKAVAKLGNDDAYQNLMYMHYCGLGTERNKEAALFYYRKQYGDTHSQMTLEIGREYLRLNGPKDLRITIKNPASRSNNDIAFEKWFSQAEDGDAQGQLELGLMYLDGIFVKKNEKIAKNYFELACKTTPANAKTVEGYYNQRGRSKEAAEWARYGEKA